MCPSAYLPSIHQKGNAFLSYTGVASTKHVRARALVEGERERGVGERAFAGSRLGSEIANSLSGTLEAPGATFVICHQV